MSKLRTKVLLQEYVRNLLNEDDFGGDMGGLDPMGGSPYGMHFASQDQLYNIFVKPFADVAGVAAGKTKELSQKAQTVLKVAFESVATTLVPILKDSYGEIFAQEKEEIDKIKSQYSDVYGATWDAFKESDVLIAAFMYRPDLFLNGAFARKAPKAAAKLLSVLSGGSLDKLLHGILSGGGGGKKTDHSEGPGMPFEGVVYEDDEKQPNSKLDKLAQVADNKKVHKALTDNPKVQKMSEAGQNMTRSTLKKVFVQAQAVLGARTLQDIQNKLGKKLPGLDKLAQVPQQERQKTELSLLAGIKKGMKEFYVKQLEGQVKAAVEAGVPQDHPFVKDYQGVISKIKAL